MKPIDFEPIDHIWNWLPERDQVVPADMLIVLGSSPTDAPAWAAELWHQKLAPFILASGGFGRISGDNTLPEADLAAQEITALGVPATEVLIENQSTNTGQNIRFSKAVLAQHDKDIKTGIIVTTPLLSRRQKASLIKQWPEIDWQITAPSNKSTEQAVEEQGDEFINLVVGEVERLEKYPDKGFSIEVEIPASIIAAKKNLVESGFDKYLIS